MKEYQVEKINHQVGAPFTWLAQVLAKLDQLWGKLTHQEFVFRTVDGRRIVDPCEVFVRMCETHDPD